MAVEARRFASADTFLDVARPFLEAREPEHQLTLGIIGDALARRGFPDDGALVAALVAGRVVATAIWTPPWNMILSEVDDERAIGAIAEALAGERLEGVHAPEEHAASLARAWSARSGTSYHTEMHERSYVLDAVSPPDGVPGALRLARRSDRDRMVAWMVAFDTEALGSEASRQDTSALVDDMLQSPARSAYIWEVAGEPVSMCQASGRTPRGIRIGAVYTPPEQRRRGYASAITAAASQDQLDQGRRWCFLFTDLANPTSNRIYQAIGYRSIRDVLVIRFDRP